MARRTAHFNLIYPAGRLRRQHQHFRDKLVITPGQRGVSWLVNQFGRRSVILGKGMSSGGSPRWPFGRSRCQHAWRGV